MEAATHIRHGHNDNVLLVVELAGSQVELETEQVPLPIRHNEIPGTADGVGDKLDNVGVDCDAGVA